MWARGTEMRAPLGGATPIGARGISGRRPPARPTQPARDARRSAGCETDPARLTKHAPGRGRRAILSPERTEEGRRMDAARDRRDGTLAIVLGVVLLVGA